jgi:mono/diheme cytochrome c family protein
VRNLFLGLILGVATASAQSGNAANGKTLFDAKYRCYTCHGYDGHGGQGARLVPMKLAQAAFMAYVRNPRQMPPYGVKIVPDAELADIFAYIKSLPESPDAKSIPLLSQLMNQ